MLGSIIGVGGSLLGGLFASRGSKSAARTQAQGATQAQQMQREMFDQQREMFEQQRQDFEPWRRQGENALRALRGETGLGAMPNRYRGFERTPGYRFELSEGMRGLNAQLAAMGLTDSGAGLRARQEFGQGLASREYGNHLARLQSMAGLGQTAAGGQAGAGNAFAGMAGQFGANMGNLAMARGNALAGGQANAANAWGSAFEGVGGALGQYFGSQGQPQTAQAMNAFVPSFGAGGAALNNMIPMGGGFR